MAFQKSNNVSTLSKVYGSLLLMAIAASALTRRNDTGQDPNDSHADAHRADGATAAGRGRKAPTPSAIPAAGWKDIFMRVKDEITDDRVGLISAGATFYLLLALFPALAAFVSIYGLFLDPLTVREHLGAISGLVPQAAVEIIEGQLERLLSQGSSELGVGFVVGLAVALWSANNGVKTLFEAMNVAYDEREKRGFIKLNLITLIFTLGAILVTAAMIGTVAVIPALLEWFHLGSGAEQAISILRWPVLFAVVFGAIVLLHRYGPSRELAQWRWVIWGSLVTAVIWVVASALFSWYLANFASYNETYGSLGAVIGLMMWTWISVQLLVIGAEFNSEMEHQTAVDTTVGRAEPMGERGAVMADTLGEPAE